MDALLPERVNVQKGCLGTAPTEGFGRSMIAHATGCSAPELLERFREVWSIVASWGRWCDEDLGEWKSNEENVSQLPKWFQDQLAKQPAFEIENWMADLHDRDWYVAGTCVVEDNLKVDLMAESLPISSWPLRFVLQLSGGDVTYDGMWRP
jgi:hypothetical protein